jgi:hypothetical protein
VCVHACAWGGGGGAGYGYFFHVVYMPRCSRQVFLQFECTGVKECTGWVCTGEHIIYAEISKHLYNRLRH